MLVAKYTLFALMATAVNLGFQWICFSVYDGAYAVYVALVTGTLAGLIAKYILDKKWIFYHVTYNQKENLQTFILYSVMGVVTTFIFWGTEILFHKWFPWQGAIYLGGALGLLVGYVIKYFLDKKYVFKQMEKGI